MKYLALALIPIVVGCLAASVDPLDDYFIMQLNSIPSMSGVYRQGHGNYDLTNWLSVTSSSSPRVITTILKAPRNAIAAKSQIWVGNSASYINIPEVNVYVGKTNEGWEMPTYSTTNDWPQIASATSLIFVRSIEKAYARCRVRLWSDSAFVESEATLLLSSLTNSCTLLPNAPGTGTTVLVTNDWSVNSLAVSNRYPAKPNSNFQRLYLVGKASNYTALYYTNHNVYIVRGPTNIAINSDYSGTIQIGTNFWRVGDVVPVDEMTAVYRLATVWLQEQIAIKRGANTVKTNAP